MSLENYSTQELKQEIERREKEAKEKAAAELKKREVIVHCYNCKGGGKIWQDVSYGYTECYFCGGSGRIKAYTVS